MSSACHIEHRLLLLEYYAKYGFVERWQRNVLSNPCRLCNSRVTPLGLMIGWRIKTWQKRFVCFSFKIPALNNYGWPYVVMDRPLCLTHVIYLLIYYLFFFRAALFEAEQRRRAGPLPDVGMWCNFITQIRGRRYLYPLDSDGRKSANFTPQLGDSATLNSCS